MLKKMTIMSACFLCTVETATSAEPQEQETRNIQKIVEGTLTSNAHSVDHNAKFIKDQLASRMELDKQLKEKNEEIRRLKQDNVQMQLNQTFFQRPGRDWLWMSTSVCMLAVTGTFLYFFLKVSTR